jgi:ATP-dependent helicase HrpB
MEPGPSPAAHPSAPVDLPVAALLPRIVAASRSSAAIVTAPPGSGKTTLVPAALLDDLPVGPAGRVLLVQPRRLAARAVARQIARLRGTALGHEVGYVVRFDRRVGPGTRLVVETTGVTLRRLADDLYLEDVGAVVLDEFHERSIELDLVLGLLIRLRQTVRPDLRVVVMSATLDAAPVARLLGDCPVLAVEARPFPVTIRHEPHGPGVDLTESVVRRVRDALRATDGHVLVFLPGVGEIARCQRALEPFARAEGHDLLPLSGDLPPEKQDLALADTGRRRIVLATNVAETSLTVPGVTAVVDSGLVRRASISPATGLPRLELGTIAKASADQRAGRAGRTGPGVCLRLWDEASHHHRPAADPPEVLRGDLAEPLLRLAALGEDDAFPWLDPPPPEAIAQARLTLARLGAVEPGGSITASGLALARLPAHPRLGRLLLAGADAGVLREAALAAALLSDRDPFRQANRSGGGPRDHATVRRRCDVVDRVRALEALDAGVPAERIDPRPHPPAAAAVMAAAEQLQRLIDRPSAPRPADADTALRRCLLAAFPDRLVRLRAGSSDRGTMVGGRGVRLDAGSRVRDEPFFLAIDVEDSGSEVRVRLASAIERAWLQADSVTAAVCQQREDLLFAPSRRQVEARRRTLWLDLVIDETPVPIGDQARAAVMLAAEARRELARWLPAADTPAGSLLLRGRWLAAARPDLGLPSVDDDALAGLLQAVCAGLRSLDEIPEADWWNPLAECFGRERLAEIDRLAPTHLTLGGRSRRLEYQPGRPPVLAVRIQELFGQRHTPRVAGGQVPVLLHLLGPNMRPQQVTDDLAGFWANTYPTVRRELRRRYPKHAWPEDPLA